MWYTIYNFLLGILVLPAGIFILVRNFRRAVREFRILSKKITGKVNLPDKVKQKRLLFWCASVGEVRSIFTLVGYLSEYEVVISVGTETGYQQANKLFSIYDYVSVTYSPLDFPWAVRRFLSKIKPDIILVVETEIWPNFIWSARRCDIPLILINGRFSRKSRRLFLLLRPMLRQLLNSFSLLLLRSESDRNNLVLNNLIVPIEITGNMKYDLGGKVDFEWAANQRNKLFARDKALVIIAGSIRPGEEKIIISAYQEVRQQISPALRLLIVPRHGEMIPTIEKYLQEKNFSYERWSQIDREKPVTVDCLVVDTIGELFNLYGLGQVAIVGGSFLDYGGQNPLEPAAWGCPVIFGKYMTNFSEEADYLVRGGGGLVAEVFSQLVDNLIILLRDSRKRIIVGENARRIQQKFSGVSEKNFVRLQELLR